MPDLRDATCAVTGGGGLIGSLLVDNLVARGAHVVVVDDFSKGRSANLAHHGDGIVVREADPERPGSARAVLEGCDVVFHLASRAYGVGQGAGRHVEILAHNEAITNNVLDAVAHLRPRHLLATSSSCVHRDDGLDTDPRTAAVRRRALAGQSGLRLGQAVPGTEGHAAGGHDAVRLRANLL